MSKEDLTLIELKNVIDEFKNNDTNEYLYWGNNRNYKLYRTIFEGSEIKEFKQRIISTIELALENRVINNYDLECSFDDVIELYPSKDVENYNIINEKIKKDEVADIKQETNLENMNFNIFRMKANYGEEKEITIIKKFNKPGMVLKQAMKFAWLGDRMKKIDEDVIYLDGQVDAFEYDGSFFILNRDRFKKWIDSIEDARQCLLVFKGEAFRGMDVGGFKAEDFFYADNHLRILSGLYGILSPFDGVHQYRLEMGTKISIRGKKDLYDFWGDTISKAVIEDIKNTGDNVLLNLASKEYFKVIEKIEEIDDEIKVITPVFKEYRDGKYKIISTKAKRARGLMTSFIIKNKIDKIEALKEFKEEGYEFCDEMSTDSELTFILNDAIYVE